MSDTHKSASAEHIEKVSPEGRPVESERSPRTVGLIYATAIVVVMLVAVAVAVFVNTPIGLMLAVLGFIGFIVNPQLWAAPGRMKDRTE